MKNLHVACVSAAFPVGDIEGNLGRICHFASLAKDEGIELVCFPELCLMGYGLGPEIQALAEPIPGPSTERLCEVSKALRVTLLVGLAERTPEGVYLSHVAIEEGKVAGVYRKVHLSPGERRGFISGQTISPIRLRHATIGIGLCLDAHIPEFSTTLLLQGTEILVFPHASPSKETPEQKRERWLRYLPARAYDNNAYLIACSLAGHRQNGTPFTPAGLILDPKGKILAERFGEEGITVGFLDAKRLSEVRARQMGFFLGFRRPELYRHLTLLLPQNKG